MAAIRNSAVATGVLTANGLSLVYTVPAGNAFILKFVGLNNGSAGSATLEIEIHDPVTNGAAYLFAGSVASGASENFSGWTVLNAGHQVYLYTSAQPLTYWIAGAVLPFA